MKGKKEKQKKIKKEKLILKLEFDFFLWNWWSALSSFFGAEHSSRFKETSSINFVNYGAKLIEENHFYSFFLTKNQLRHYNFQFFHLFKLSLFIILFLQ